VSKLVRHFVNPRVGAVAGNVEGRESNQLAHALGRRSSYITSQNLEKRAFDSAELYSGGSGRSERLARRSHQTIAAGFSADTVAEDTDLTITIRRAGWKINYDEEAIGWTERAPKSAAALVPPAFPLDVRHIAGVLET